MGAQIEDYPETPLSSHYYDIEGLIEEIYPGSHYAERRETLKQLIRLFFHHWFNKLLTFTIGRISFPNKKTFKAVLAIMFTVN